MIDSLIVWIYPFARKVWEALDKRRTEISMEALEWLIESIHGDEEVSDEKRTNTFQ